jgi:hypothetical protein
MPGAAAGLTVGVEVATATVGARQARAAAAVDVALVVIGLVIAASVPRAGVSKRVAFVRALRVSGARDAERACRTHSVTAVDPDLSSVAVMILAAIGHAAMRQRIAGC